MTLEELRLQKKLFIDAYEKYPKKKGYRTDLKNQDKFNRSQQILSHLAHIWPNSNTYIGHHLEKIYNHLLKEKEDGKLFFSRKLFHHKWKPVTLIKFIEDGFLDMDVENKFEDMLYNDLTISVKKTKEILQNYYKKKIGHLYVMDLVSENEHIPELPVKKIGYTDNITRRLKANQTWLPYTIIPKIYIIVEGYHDYEIESLVHKKFEVSNIKLEMFLDLDNKLINEILDYVISLPNIKIKKIYTEEELIKKYRIKTNKKDVFIPNFIKNTTPSRK